MAVIPMFFICVVEIYYGKIMHGRFLARQEADIILVLEDSEAKEIGSHEELIQKNGII